MNEIDIIKIAINSSENLSKEKRDECIDYIKELKEDMDEILDDIECYRQQVAMYMKNKHDILEIVKNDDYSHIEKLQEIYKILNG